MPTPGLPSRRDGGWAGPQWGPRGARGSARSFSPARLEVAGLAGWEASTCASAPRRWGGGGGVPKSPQKPAVAQGNKSCAGVEERSPLVCEVARKAKASICWRQAETSAGERSLYRSEVLCRLKPASVSLFWKVTGNASGVWARFPVWDPRYPLSRCGILGGESSWCLSVMQIIKVSL